MCLNSRKRRIISARIDDYQQVNPNTNLSLKTTRHTGGFFGNCCQARVLFVNTCLYRLASGGLELLPKGKGQRLEICCAYVFEKCIIHWICLFAVCFVFPLRASCLKRCPIVFACLSPDNTHAADDCFSVGLQAFRFFPPAGSHTFCFCRLWKIICKDLRFEHLVFWSKEQHCARLIKTILAWHYH